MTAKPTLRSFRPSNLLLLQLLLLTIIVTSFSPAFAQTTADIVGELRSLPPQAQSNALRRFQYFYEQRAYPYGQIPPGAMLQARQEHEQQFGPVRAQQQPAAPSFPQNQWTSIGPDDISTVPTTSGRLNAIAIDPTNLNIIYVGAATGGVWKTTDGGASWTALTDAQCSTAMGSIALDPTNPQIVYAGTGEENFSSDSYYGCGVLKSTDGGASWTQMGAAIFATTSGGARIAKIAVHPITTSTLLVASTFGLYRSTDGGVSFTQVLPGIATDVVIDPASPSTIYAAIGSIGGSTANGVYKSTDAGVTWTMLGGGFPTSNVGRISLAIAASASATIYAAVQNSSTNQLLGIWKTTDGGASWTQLTATGTSCASQCWYDLSIAVDPTNANIVYFGGLSVYRSSDGGASFSDIGALIHPDHHTLAFLPGTPTTIFAGCDGGLFMSADSGASWTSLNTNLATLQFYPGLSADPTSAGTVMGGTQDNGTVRTTGAAEWDRVSGGDGGYTAIDFVTPSTAYAEIEWNQPSSGPRRSDDVGVTPFMLKTTGINLHDSAQFIPPLVMSPSNSQTLYFGTNKVYLTINSADAWTPSGTTLTANVTTIAQAPSDATIIYVGTANGTIWKSADANASYASISTGLPNRFARALAVHPTDPNTAYVTFSGFGTGHVFKTTTGGTSWVDISGNLPNIPVNAIVLDPGAPTTEILIGTDLGVYRTHDGGTTWSPFNVGLPDVPVLDLVYNMPTGVLLAATHGRGVWQASVGGLPRTATHDFNGDRKSDIAWRDTGGNTAVWLMNGASLLQSAGLGSAPTTWSVVGQRDFNGDGKSDWLWHDTSGNVAMWFLNGAAVVQSAGVGTVPTVWSIAGTGDFNGDGKGDVLWADSNGNVAVWLMNGAQLTQSAGLGSASTTWSIVETGDFDGDGKSDILWHDTSGTVAIWFMNGTQVTQSAGVGVVPAVWSIQGVNVD